MGSPTFDAVSGVLLHDHVASDITDLTTTLDTRYINVSGDTMTGNLTMNGGNIVMTGTETVDGVDVSAHASNASAHHAPVTLGTNTATALSLSGQQISIADVFLQNGGDISTGTLQVGTSPATYLYTTGVIDAGLRLTLATNPAISREGVGGVVSNIWVGVSKPSGLTTGYQNVIVAGDSGATTAGKSITSGYKNFLLGSGSGYNIAGGFSNVLIGIESGASITSGGGNIGIGAQVFYGANPNNATAIGQFSGYNLLTGYGIYIGDRAGYTQQYGFHNSCIGDYSGYSNNAGSDNTHVGWYSGYNMTGNRNVTLGAFAGNNVAFAGLDDRLIIANSTTSTPLIYGNFSTAILTFNGGMIVNEQGGNYDTRIEGDTDANLLFADASADTVQVGSATTSDSAKFYVSGKISTSGEMEINGDLNHDGSSIGFFGVTPTTRQTELTDELTTITFTAPSTPDYAIQDLTNSGGYGFVTKDEGNTLLSVVANLQTRVNELETKLVAYGLLIDAD